MLFLRSLLPRVYTHGRWMCHRSQWRWMSSKRNIPISMAKPSVRQGRQGLGQSSPSNIMAQLESDFEDMGRRLQQLRGQLFTGRSTTNEVTGIETSDIQVTHTDKELEMRLNLKQFSPEDLKVEVADGKVVISGKHDEKADEFGHVTREFKRQIVIPEDCDPDSVTSILEDGILIIVARVGGSEPPISHLDERDEREVRDDRHG